MDPIVRTNIDVLILELKKTDMNIDDPVSKLMVSTLLHQAQKIRDEIENIPAKVLDRLCSYFIPKNKLDAMPALCFVQPSLKNKKDIEPHTLIDGISFTYKIDSKLTLSYYPLFRNNIVPFTTSHILTSRFLVSRDSRVDLHAPENGQVWIGLELPAEIDTLENMSFYIKGTSGLLPEKIYIGNNMTELSYATGDNISEIPMMEPFDAQQTTPSSIETLSSWKSILTGVEGGRLIYITESIKDRDIFKCKAYPKSFQQLLESNDLDKFENNTLWILFDFGEACEVPLDIEIIPNVVPVVNVNINSVTLTRSSPIAKLTKADGSFFLNVIETSLPARKQGFNVVGDEVIIRDFDCKSYDSSVLYRDVRNLYNRFVDDYHAFVDYHDLKDGELVRSLREIVNKIGKSVTLPQEIKNKYDTGVYAMRSIGIGNQISSIKLSYLTSFGRLGNKPQVGDVMENRKDAAIEKDIKVIVAATGGEDMAGADERYEMLRYYTLTSDRLFTKMDIDAFLRMQLLKEFGKDEIKRICYEITVQGVGGAEKLMRGLFIDIRFKDQKNFGKALSSSFDRRLKQLLLDKSCLSMPVIVNLVNIESE